MRHRQGAGRPTQVVRSYRCNVCGKPPARGDIHPVGFVSPSDQIVGIKPWLGQNQGEHICWVCHKWGLTKEPNSSQEEAFISLRRMGNAEGAVPLLEPALPVQAGRSSIPQELQMQSVDRPVRDLPGQKVRTKAQRRPKPLNFLEWLRCRVGESALFDQEWSTSEVGRQSAADFLAGQPCCDAFESRHVNRSMEALSITWVSDTFTPEGKTRVQGETARDAAMGQHDRHLLAKELIRPS